AMISFARSGSDDHADLIEATVGADKIDDSGDDGISADGCAAVGSADMRSWLPWLGRYPVLG
ncbi:MAG TPA: hypothetical protein VEU30_00105, partial [Thermoanaerobaculia bacterium]|nr:hypothetical protein [Thermoanaerobaculia bacterium]